jgi:hypothetical protein
MVLFLDKKNKKYRAEGKAKNSPSRENEMCSESTAKPGISDTFKPKHAQAAVISISFSASAVEFSSRHFFEAISRATLLKRPVMPFVYLRFIHSSYL